MSVTMPPLCRSVEPLQRYGLLAISFSKWRTSAILDSFYANLDHHRKEHLDDLVVFVTVQNLVGIGALVSIICKF